MKFRLMVLAALAGSTCFAADPALTLSSQSIALTATAGGTAPPLAVVGVTSDLPIAITGASVSYISGPSGWLTLVPSFGTGIQTPVVLQVGAAITGLVAGNYIAEVRLTASGALAPASVNSFTVFLRIDPPSGTVPSTTISAVPSTLLFSWQQGTSLPPARSLAIATNDGSPFDVRVVTDNGRPWLAVSATAGTSPSLIGVSVDPTVVTPGEHGATITVTVPPHASVQIPVTLSVAKPAVAIAPDSLTIRQPRDAGISAAYTLSVTAPSPTALTAFAASVGNWLIVDPPNSNTPATLRVRVNNARLAEGTYSGSVALRTGPESEFAVPVTLVVGPPSALQFQPGALSFAFKSGEALPGPQTVSITSTGASRRFTIAGGASWLTVLASASTTPAVLTFFVTLPSVAPGIHSAIVDVTDTTAASTQQIIVDLNVQPGTRPVIASVANAASFQTGAVAPGEFVTLFGFNLGPSVLALPAPGTAPTSLASTTVLFGGIPAPIVYASSAQTTVQVPYGIDLLPTQLSVLTGSEISETKILASAATAPGLFTANASGEGQLAALNQDFTVNSQTNPAARGEFIFLYGTGAGRTVPQPKEGTIVTAVEGSLPRTVAPVTVIIGGKPAVVHYAGETPGALAGLFQINAIVPLAIDPGPTVPVIVTIGGGVAQSNVWISVR